MEVVTTEVHRCASLSIVIAGRFNGDNTCGCVYDDCGVKRVSVWTACMGRLKQGSWWGR